MAIPDHNYNHNDVPHTPHHYEESLDQWLCAICFKTISATRPPVFNPENCSCGVEGGGGTSQQRGVGVEGYDNTTTYNKTSSESAQSFSSPEGPEKEEFDIKGLGEGYLPLTQTPNIEHHDMSYQMNRFLCDDQRETPQDGYWNTGSSKRSWGSDQSRRGSGEEMGWNSGFGESIGEMGAWINDFGTGYGGVEMVREGAVYPMVLSGVTEGGGEVRG